ncbi:MAG: DNA methyltransferase [Candidatus Heimdallarchaeota archaeon]
MGSMKFLDAKKISDIKQLAIPEREQGVTRTYYSYPAKFLAKLPRGLISRFTSEGDLVLDPFVGGGTTGLEAMILNRKFIGYDINPFAIFVSKVKTTYIEPERLNKELIILSQDRSTFSEGSNVVLDQEDKICLGPQISSEIESLASKIGKIRPENIQQFFKLALIHSVKIIGRRDFENRKGEQIGSIYPIFERKSHKMIRNMADLPRYSQYTPKFVQSSSQNLDIIQNNDVDLIIGSPPYKDKDIEYQQLQIQRRSLRKSKRTEIISKLLGTQPLHRSILCWTGEKGEVYWKTSIEILKECFRVLKPGNFGFFWTGFKSPTDAEKYCEQLTYIGFQLVTIIPVELSHDRSASSRSTHHGRPTNMMSFDSLFIVQKL